MKSHPTIWIGDAHVSINAFHQLSVALNYVPTYEVNVANIFSRFKCIPFCSFEDDDKKFIRGGCVAQLKHSELGGLLASDDKDFTDDGLCEVFLWKYKGKEGDNENFNTQSLFELELAQ